MSRKVEIVEVGPRDGLQNEAVALSVADRLDLIRRLEACGARRIEAVSFVNPKRVPQMAGAEEIMAGLPHAEGRSRIGLVLNLRGWERLKATSCDEANVVVCATDSFGLKNQGAAVAAQIDAMHAIAADRAAQGGPPLSLTISVAFGCPFEGEVPLDRVVQIAREGAAAKIPEIAIADTIGVADPWAVRARMAAVRAVAPDAKLRLHFHDTRNTGLANAAAAVEAGDGFHFVQIFAGVEAVPILSLSGLALVGRGPGAHAAWPVLAETPLGKRPARARAEVGARPSLAVIHLPAAISPSRSSPVAIPARSSI